MPSHFAPLKSPLGPVGPANSGAPSGERRTSSRVPFTAEITAVEQRSQASVVSRTSDLSKGGCYVDTMTPFPVGTEMHIRLTRSNTSFHAKANVIYSQIGMGMGLAFTDIAPAQRVVLQKWLAELRDDLPGPTVSDESVAYGQRQGKDEPKSGAVLALEELVVLLAEKHLINEDESEAILHRLKEI